jgi:hypothetical protein
MAAGAFLAYSPTAYADYTISGGNIYQADVGVWWTPFFDATNTNQQGAENRDPDYVRYHPYHKNSSGNVVIGPYTSNEVNVIDYQIDLMTGAGIDFVISDLTNGFGSGKDATKLMLAQDRIDVAVAIGGPLKKAHLTYEEANEGANREANAVYNELVSVYSNYKQFQGKPLMVTYSGYDNGNTPAPYWYDYRFSIQRATGHVDADNPNLTDQGYNWDSWWGWLNEGNFLSTEAMLVSPGWDTAHNPRPSNKIKDRRDGNEYMDQWLTALEMNPEAIIIASWNDYNEETHIEPSEPIAGSGAPTWDSAQGNQTSDLYLQITTAYTAFQDSVLLEGYFYRDNDDNAVYTVSNGSLNYVGGMGGIGPNSPIIRLPDQTLAGILAANSSSVSVPEPGASLYVLIALLGLTRRDRVLTNQPRR